MDWKKLQNGSDIRGVALPDIKNETVNLNENTVEQLGKSFGIWLKKYYPEKKKLKVSVGMDARISGPALRKAVMNGLLSTGFDVLDCGMASTPAMFMSTIIGENQTDAGIMLTASHLPFNRNGMKFFTKQGGLDKKDIAEILEIAEIVGAQNLAPLQNTVPAAGTLTTINFMNTYSEHFVNMVREKVNHSEDYEKPLKGLKIVVDAGNGAGGFYAEKILKPLGADISDSQFLEPDGLFPNHVPNPEDETAMASVVEKVKASKADFGIIFDTDVDRAAFVANDGFPINRNALIALISAIVLEEHPETTIVTDSITSNGLNRFINEQLKGKHHRFKRGYKNVINEAIRLNESGEACMLAIETSGHAALRENYFLDDGAYLATKIIITLAKMRQKGQSLISLIKDLQIPAESRELRIKIQDIDFKSCGEKIIADLETFVQNKEGWEIVPNNFEGIRVNCNAAQQQGWFLLRLSLHDPILPLNVESEVEGGVNRMINELLSFFGQYKDQIMI